MTPGLIARRIIGDTDADTVVVMEDWDLSAPGCPLVVIDLPTGKRSDHATTMTRFIRMGRAEADQLIAALHAE